MNEPTTWKCETNADCLEGEKCLVGHGGSAVAYVEEVGTCRPEDECFVNADCDPVRSICKSGKCTAPFCTASNEVTACRGNKCNVSTGECSSYCSSSTGCASGYACYTSRGWCLQTCVTSADCPSYFACVNGMCPFICYANTDCKTGYRCGVSCEPIADAAP